MSQQPPIVTDAVKNSKIKRTRWVLILIAVLFLLLMGTSIWTSVMVLKRSQAQAEAGQDLASQVQAACNDTTPDSASLTQLCENADKVLLKGATGDTGPQGPAGPPGPPGENGTNGADGKNGQNGTDGSDGQNGTNGKDGQPGPAGPPGPQGPAGKDGTNGADGTNGTDATPFTFTFTISGPGNQSATYSCTVAAPNSTATCTRTS